MGAASMKHEATVRSSINVLHILVDLNVGGGQYYVLRHLMEFDSRRVASFVCSILPASERDNMEPLFRQSGAKLLYLGHRRAWQFPGKLWELVRLIRTWQIDLIHTNNVRSEGAYGHAAALLTGVPEVETLHWIEDSPPVAAPVLFRARLASRRALRLLEARFVGRRILRGVITYSEAVRRSKAAYLRALGLPPEDAPLIYPGLDMSRFRPLALAEKEALRQELGIARASPLLVNVARLVGFKGQSLLIPLMSEITRRWREAHLLIAGEGEERQALEAAIATRGLQGHITLPGSRSDVARLLALADVFVFPSYAEAFGFALLEAMAAGVPVAAFRLPVFAEFVKDGVHGRLVDPFDGQALIDAVTDLLEEPEKARAMGQAGRDQVTQRFSARESTAAVERTYLSICRRAHVPWRGGD
jgi:glycosyltransferase involved in cell wall biosynthesis